MAEKKHLLGIDLGGTKILGGVIDPKGKIIARAKKKTKADQDPKVVLERIAKVARDALDEAGVGVEAIECIGVGAPGPLDPIRGVILEAPNLGWVDVDLKGYLQNELNIPAYVNNDVNAGAWGEYCLGAGRDAKICLGVFVGTGIGGGLIINDALFEGASHVAGEIGHTCLNYAGPAMSGSPMKGSLEAYASRTAIARDLFEMMEKGEKTILRDLLKSKETQIRSKILKKAYTEGDKLVVQVVNNAARLLGVGLASAANLLNPDRIVLGGGVVEALGEDYIKIVRKEFEKRAFKSVIQAVQIVEAQLGDDAGVLGASLLAQRAHEQVEVVG